MVGTVKFETRIKELVENLPDLAVLVEPLLIVRRVLREHGNRTGPKAGGAGGAGADGYRAVSLLKTLNAEKLQDFLAFGVLSRDRIYFFHKVQEIFPAS
jgi:hypothetical protein